MPTRPPLPTPVPSEEVERAVRGCLAGISPQRITQAAQEMKVCLDDSSLAQGENYGARTFAVEGELPVMLLGLLGPDCRFTYEYLAWWRDGGWQVQYLTPQLPLCDYTLFASPPSTPAARQLDAPDGVRLVVINTVHCCGSAPSASLLLLGLHAAGWQIVWDGEKSDMANLSHREVEFVDEGIDLIKVRGDSWFYADEKKDIFNEGNPGPHRHFEETWTLQEDGYVRLEHRVVPSAYNTLVEFVYRLSTGDELGAGALVVDPSLLAAAKALGVVQSPLGQRWMTNLEPTTECCGPIYITDGLPQQVKVSFVQSGDGWQLSEMKAERYQPPY